MKEDVDVDGRCPQGPESVTMDVWEVQGDSEDTQSVFLRCLERREDGRMEVDDGEETKYLMG